MRVVRARRCWRVLGLLVCWLLLIAAGPVAPAHGSDRQNNEPGSGQGSGASSEGRSRATWAALLAGYVALSAFTIGAAYVLRENLVGRNVAVSAAAWGGLGVGAGVGYGLVQLHGCEAPDCSGAQDVAVAVGGLLGALGGTIAGYLLTSDAGMSRPRTAAAGMVPAFLFLSIGTVIDW